MVAGIENMSIYLIFFLKTPKKTDDSTLCSYLPKLNESIQGTICLQCIYIYIYIISLPLTRFLKNGAPRNIDIASCLCIKKKILSVLIEPCHY